MSEIVDFFGWPIPHVFFVPATLFSMPLLCVGHDDVSFISLFAVCHYFHFPGASRPLCFTLTFFVYTAPCLCAPC